MTAETETIVESTVEELIGDVEVAEIEELQPVIDAAEQLPEVVPGLAVPESPALPEDGPTVSAKELVPAESAVESLDSIVATPAETSATPE